ncbi:primosomal replicatioN protein n [Burkholderia pseudomallei]|nr:primosomal replicatioN protein n [Burkholderia pseudomallei]KEO70816.1 primosomal replicatioN protein n [Burkholderia pseudomallei MSHR5855]KIX54741.1 primosomal replicatioN protein n [Burkholderia pseudomallei]KJR95630.1 primosomal replicatioN protein n [Burkholderia pseudomallei]KNA33358.1 primosomal replicatioN protein n [Burkholderia pseudomallei]
MPTAGGISAMQWGITFVYASFIADIPDCAVVSARFARAA